MFAPDHAAVAGELARVCRPGGRLALACWRPNVGVHDVFKLMAPFQPPAPAGIGNPFDWGSEEHVTALLSDTFDLEFEDGDCPQTAESAESVWELFSTSYGPTKALVASLEPERREALRQSVRRPLRAVDDARRRFSRNLPARARRPAGRISAQREEHDGKG